MFDTAPALKAVTRTTKKREARQVEIQGLKKLAAIRDVISQLEAFKEAIEQDVKSAVEIEFINSGTKTKARPANFKGIDDNVNASCELHARAKSRALVQEEIDALSQAGIPTVTVADRPETFVINPAYKDDAELLDKVARKLRKVPGIPKDFFLKQEAASKTIPDTNALDVLFTKDIKTICKLLTVLSTVVIKNVEHDEDDGSFAIIEDLLARVSGSNNDARS